jgi:hypothetical protein
MIPNARGKASLDHTTDGGANAIEGLAGVKVLGNPGSCAHGINQEPRSQVQHLIALEMTNPEGNLIGF